MFREEHQLHAVGKSGALDAGFDVGGGWVEGFALLLGRAALEVLEAIGGVGRGGNLSSVGRRGGNELAEGAVGRFEVSLGHAENVGRGYLGDFFVIEEEVAPVAATDGFAEHQGDSLRVGFHEIVLLGDAGLGAVDFFLGGRGCGKVLNVLEQNFSRFVDGLVRL